VLGFPRENDSFLLFFDVPIATINTAAIVLAAKASTAILQLGIDDNSVQRIHFSRCNGTVCAIKMCFFFVQLPKQLEYSVRSNVVALVYYLVALVELSIEKPHNAALIDSGHLPYTLA